VTAPGRKIVASRTVKARPRPGKRNRAKPYATSVQEMTVPMVPISASNTVFSRACGKSMRPQTLA